MRFVKDNDVISEASANVEALWSFRLLPGRTVVAKTRSASNKLPTAKNLVVGVTIGSDQNRLPILLFSFPFTRYRKKHTTHRKRNEHAGFFRFDMRGGSDAGKMQENDPE